MMIFEEEFPSIDACWNYNAGSLLDRAGAKISGEFSPMQRKIMQDCCLDKQRVKEAINRILSTPRNGLWKDNTALDFSIEVREDLFEELGL